MELPDLFPSAGHVQRLYCDVCKGHLDLAFAEFHEDVSGIEIVVYGLPVLRCDRCNRDHLPDRSRVAVIELHRRATKSSSPVVRSTRKKLEERFKFGPVEFLYDADDYRYIPGLERPWDTGFLTPVFFNKAVLLKYDNSPGYRVTFASPSYGTIDGGEFDISFGINRAGKVLMWLGDIGSLPDSEQYYLRSENVASDHSIGSDFYDGQIECIFTEPPLESKLFKLRSEFVDACLSRFGVKVAHLEAEALEMARSFNPPVVDTEKERRHVADVLNKIYIESFDNGALGEIMTTSGLDPAKLGSLKRLEAVIESIANKERAAEILCPLYVLYDMRVAYSHLTSMASAAEKLETVTMRLGLPNNSGLLILYPKLVVELVTAFAAMTDLVCEKPKVNAI